MRACIYVCVCVCVCASTNDARHGRAVNPPHSSRVYIYIHIYIIIIFSRFRVCVGVNCSAGVYNIRTSPRDFRVLHVDTTRYPTPRPAAPAWGARGCAVCGLSLYVLLQNGRWADNATEII